MARTMQTARKRCPPDYMAVRAVLERMRRVPVDRMLTNINLSGAPSLCSRWICELREFTWPGAGCYVDSMPTQIAKELKGNDTVTEMHLGGQY